MDFFKILPDELVLSIFNKLQDSESLCSSMCVCKRFRSIASQVDNILIHIPRKSNAPSNQETFKNLATTKDNSNLQYFYVPNEVLKPLSENPSFNISVDHYKAPYIHFEFRSFYDPNESLKPFPKVRSLHLKLGSNETSIGNSRTFLKWKAEFGTSILSCVVVAAKSLTDKPENEDQEKKSNVRESFSEDELKLRRVLAASCMMAVSARYFLIYETVRSEKFMIRNVVVSDEKDEGWVCMSKEKIEEMKRDGDHGSINGEHLLRMKLWYLQKLELPVSGKVMEEATLMVIRKVAAGGDEAAMISDEELASASEFGVERDGKVIGEAIARFMVAKNCYTWELNKFL